TITPFILLREATPIVPPSTEDAKFAVMFKIMLATPTIMICAVVFGAIEQSFIYFLPVYDTRLGHTEYAGRMLLLVAALGNALFQFPMGVLADKMNRKVLTALLMSIAFIGPAAMALVGANSWALGILAFFYMGLTTALYTVGLVQLGERFKGHQLSAANAGFIVSYGIGSLIVPPLAGKLMDIYNPQGFMWAMAGLGFVGLTVVSLRFRHRGF
ncbi:MAG TPA: MFS transporter, partial [Ghiorsea sp.]|nr:MFS transporter [Ghiorsea sp.]